MRAKGILAACLMAVSGIALGADALPAGARIGIIDMVSTDVTHFHVGRSSLRSFMRTYNAEWPAAEIIDAPLASELKSAGFEPVAVEPSDQLHRQRRSWIVSDPESAKLPKACLEELARIATAENLSALIIVASGTNASPDNVEGNPLRKLPAYVQGWGFSTSDASGGTTRPVVFNLTQMLFVRKAGDGAELDYREWGGGYVYEWPGFEPGPDLKAVPQTEIDKLRPVIADVLQRQIARLMPHIGQSS